VEDTPTAQKVVKIAIFEDCTTVFIHYEKLFTAMERKVELRLWTRVKDSTLPELVQFNPDLIITNLMLQASVEDGFVLIPQFQEVLHAVPIVVLSKHVSDRNLAGLEMKVRCLKAGAVAAFSKFPNYPPAEDFLQFVH